MVGKGLFNFLLGDVMGICYNVRGRFDFGFCGEVSFFF